MRLHHESVHQAAQEFVETSGNRFLWSRLRIGALSLQGVHSSLIAIGLSCVKYWSLVVENDSPILKQIEKT